MGDWLMYIGNQPFGKRFNLWTEAQYRNYNLVGDLEQLLLRTGVGMNLTENNNNLLLGYAFVHTEPYIDGTDRKRSFDEHRIFQQLVTRQGFGRLLLQHRYRLEQRFFRGDFRVRFRYALGVNLLLNAPKMDKGTCYLAASNEIFIHGDKPVYDRDRVYAGIGYVLRKDLRMEVGVMSQILESRTRPQLQIGLFNGISLRK